MIKPLLISNIALAVTLVAFVRNAHSRREGALKFGTIINDLVTAQDEMISTHHDAMQAMQERLDDIEGENNETAVMHAMHAAVAIETLDAHVADTQPLDDAKQALVDALRPYYEMTTIH